MSIESDYDDLNIVRMAIMERDDRLVVLMPQGTSPQEAEEFIKDTEKFGWLRDRIAVLVGPEAFAVMKQPDV